MNLFDKRIVKPFAWENLIQAKHKYKINYDRKTRPQGQRAIPYIC